MTTLPFAEMWELDEMLTKKDIKKKIVLFTVRDI